VRADEKLAGFLELGAAIAATANVEETTWQTPEPWAAEGLTKANLFHYFISYLARKLSLCIRQILEGAFAEDPPRHHEVFQGSVRHYGSSAGFSQGRTLDAAVVIPASVWGAYVSQPVSNRSPLQSSVAFDFGRDPLKPLPFLEIAVVLVRLDHGTGFTVNANHSLM
jgi:hypothetical protein